MLHISGAINIQEIWEIHIPPLVIPDYSDKVIIRAYEQKTYYRKG